MGGTDRGIGWTADTLAALTLAGVTFHPLCNLVFRCGCAWFFAGAAEHYNIHDPAPPNCPPCNEVVAGVTFGAAMIAGWLLAVRGIRSGYARTR